ncbi:hypothetical protein BJY01DRAFT_246718 [Aspergillus pseudoustus]|uniref:F-box domain-containing protein n=1 Tax=Aspergillus pseudoustus TaxID=1810923 RepID=A0ABR4K680_9EURO
MSPLLVHSRENFTSCILCGGTTVTVEPGRADTIRVYPALAEQADDNKPCACYGLGQLSDLARAFPARSPALTTRMATARTSSDPFERLPLELRQEFAFRIPTPDFLNLRYASRSIGRVFDDGIFWQVKFQQDRKFLLQCLPRGRVAGNNDLDFRLLYQAGSRVENDFETTKLMPLPLAFYGRALHSYHGPMMKSGLRVERVQLSSPPLVTLGVSFESTQHPVGTSGATTLEDVAHITGFDLTAKDGTQMTLGESPCNSVRTIRARDLPWTEPTKYYHRRGYEPHHEWADHVWAHRFGAAHLAGRASFHGSHISYNAEAIYSIGVISSEGTAVERGCNALGAAPGTSHVFDLHMDEVTEVVATWQDRKLVDLGVRGQGVRRQLHGFPPRNFVAKGWCLGLALNP